MTVTAIPLGYSPTGDDAVCDLDALAIAVSNAAGAASAASSAASSAVTTANATNTAVSVVSLAAANAQATANVALANAATAEADAQAALAGVALALTQNDVATVVNVKSAVYGALGNGVHDDTAAIQAASNALNAAGGGTLYFPKGRYLISADVTITRLINVLGAGGGVSILVASPQVRFQTVGAGSNDVPVIEKMGFDGVQVAYGVTNADHGRACQLVACQIQNVDKGVYYGHNSYLTKIDRCVIENVDDGVYFDFATAGVNSGAVMTITNGELTNCINSVVVNGNTADGHHIIIIGVDLEHTTGACLKTIGTSEGRIVLRDCHYELNTGVIIDNDGGNIFLEGYLCASITETSFIKQSAGNTFVRGGSRQSWVANKFALITGGTIVVEPQYVFCASRWASEGVVTVPVGGSGAGFGAAVPMVAAGSTGGKIILGSGTAFRSQTDVVLTTLTNASPGPVTASIIWKRDGNNRTWTFAFSVTAVTTDNSLRMDLANGVSTVRIDFNMPLFVGGGEITLSNIVGVGGAAGAFSARGYFAETASGKVTRLHATTPDDAGALGLDRSLVFSSVKSGLTAATITVDRLDEMVSGPTFVGL